MARVSLRQLQWWDEERVIEPRHVGHHREYTQTQLIEAVAVSALRRHTFSLQAIRRHLRALKRELADCSAMLEVGEDVLLLVNPATLKVIHDPNDIKNLLINSKDAWHLISIQKELNQGRKTKAA